MHLRKRAKRRAAFPASQRRAPLGRLVISPIFETCKNDDEKLFILKLVANKWKWLESQRCQQVEAGFHSRRWMKAQCSSWNETIKVTTFRVICSSSCAPVLMTSDSVISSFDSAVLRAFHRVYSRVRAKSNQEQDSAVVGGNWALMRKLCEMNRIHLTDATVYCFVGVVSLLLYVNSLNGEFVYDDR